MSYFTMNKEKMAIFNNIWQNFTKALLTTQLWSLLKWRPSDPRDGR